MKTREEKVRDNYQKWRNKIKSDPIKRAQYLKKRRDNYSKRKAENKIKSVANMTPREKKTYREKKRNQKRKERAEKMEKSRIIQHHPEN